MAWVDSDHNVSAERLLQQELKSIIAQQRITALFQPIHDLEKSSVFAFEALSRGPQESLLFFPDVMFDVADRHQMMAELDYVCTHRAVEAFVAGNLPGKLSLNVCPEALADPHFRNGQTLTILEQAGLSSERVIIEITEHKQADIPRLKTAVNYYRDMGFTIALDDLGAGYSNLRLLAELQPDYLKMDKFFISGVNDDCIKADFVKVIVALAERVGCRVVAEGIETVDELQFVRSHGINFGQGYLLGRPMAGYHASSPEILLETVKRNIVDVTTVEASEQETVWQGERQQIRTLALHQTPPCHPDDPLNSVLKRFQDNPQLSAVPVVDAGGVVGALIRDALLEAFSMPFAHSLYRKADVSQLMLTSPLVVDLSESLTVASQQATSRSHSLVYCPLIVCDNGNYVGMVSIRELLEKITRTQVEHALHCNPLSELPGNLSIASEVQERIDQQRHCVLSHFDLDGFKAFNDKYGFERGDQMIRLVAELLRAMATRSGDFVGHIGGDDFVLVQAAEPGWEERIWRMLDDFSANSLRLYDADERAAGFIEAEDRHGVVKRFSLATLSVSAVIIRPGKFTSHLEASEVLAEIKHQSKRIEGNSLVVDRRQS